MFSLIKFKRNRIENEKGAFFVEAALAVGTIFLFLAGIYTMSMYYITEANLEFAAQQAAILGTSIPGLDDYDPTATGADAFNPTGHSDGNKPDGTPTFDAARDQLIARASAIVDNGIINRNAGGDVNLAAFVPADNSTIALIVPTPDTASGQTLEDVYRENKIEIQVNGHINTVFGTLSVQGKSFFYREPRKTFAFPIAVDCNGNALEAGETATLGDAGCPCTPASPNAELDAGGSCVCASGYIDTDAGPAVSCECISPVDNGREYQAGDCNGGTFNADTCSCECPEVLGADVDTNDCTFTCTAENSIASAGSCVCDPTVCQNGGSGTGSVATNDCSCDCSSATATYNTDNGALNDLCEVECQTPSGNVASYDANCDIATCTDPTNQQVNAAGTDCECINTYDAASNVNQNASTCDTQCIGTGYQQNIDGSGALVNCECTTDSGISGGCNGQSVQVAGNDCVCDCSSIDTTGYNTDNTIVNGNCGITCQASVNSSRVEGFDAQCNVATCRHANQDVADNCNCNLTAPENGSVKDRNWTCIQQCNAGMTATGDNSGTLVCTCDRNCNDGTRYIDGSDRCKCNCTGVTAPSNGGSKNGDCSLRCPSGKTLNTATNTCECSSPATCAFGTENTSTCGCDCPENTTEFVYSGSTCTQSCATSSTCTINGQVRTLANGCACQCPAGYTEDSGSCKSTSCTDDDGICDSGNASICCYQDGSGNWVDGINPATNTPIG